MKNRRALVLASLMACLSAGCCCPASREAMVADLVGARITRRPIAPLTHTYGAMSIDEAYRVQDGVTRMIVESADEVVGYKVAFAGQAARDAWGVRECVYGPLFQSMAVADGGAVDLAAFITFDAEVEVAFVVGRRIDKPVKDVAQLRGLVCSVCAALDLPTQRYDARIARPRAADVVADGAGACRFVLGPPVDPATVDVDKLTLTITRDGKEVHRGESARVMGGPWRSLLWLANALIARGQALQPGDVVLSGAVAAPYSPARRRAAGTYVGDGGPLGRVTCKVIERGGSDE